MSSDLPGMMKNSVLSATFHVSYSSRRVGSVKRNFSNSRRKKSVVTVTRTFMRKNDASNRRSGPVEEVLTYISKLGDPQERY